MKKFREIFAKDIPSNHDPKPTKNGNVSKTFAWNQTHLQGVQIYVVHKGAVHSLCGHYMLKLNRLIYLSGKCVQSIEWTEDRSYQVRFESEVYFVHALFTLTSSCEMSVQFTLSGQFITATCLV